MVPPLRIGTAGWNVPSRYAPEMPSDGSQLERYARRLNAAEINSSFYRPHRRLTYERWAGSTPTSFRFSVKVPRAITHERQLVECAPLLDRFLSEATGLGEKLGCLLVQLPPKAAFAEKIADMFLRDLQERVDAPVAVEPRHESWFAPAIDAWLADRRVARVAADPARVPGAGVPGGWRKLAYFRWHGSPRMYFSNYDADALAELGRRLVHCRARGASTWCIFDNTGSGSAFGNALALASSERTEEGALC